MGSFKIWNQSRTKMKKAKMKMKKMTKMILTPVMKIKIWMKITEMVAIIPQVKTKEEDLTLLMKMETTKESLEREKESQETN